MRIYKATFNSYTGTGNVFIVSYENNSRKHIFTDHGALIITEHDLEKFMHYGNGFKTLEYVGTMPPEVTIKFN